MAPLSMASVGSQQAKRREEAIPRLVVVRISSRARELVVAAVGHEKTDTPAQACTPDAELAPHVRSEVHLALALEPALGLRDDLGLQPIELLRGSLACDDRWSRRKLATKRPPSMIAGVRPVPSASAFNARSGRNAPRTQASAMWPRRQGGAAGRRGMCRALSGFGR